MKRICHDQDPSFDRRQAEELSASSTRPAASSFPIRGTSAARAICRASAFQALATTSSGYAHSQGYPDGALSRDQVLAHFREMAEATDVPLNADFEDGLADSLDGSPRM